MALLLAALMIHQYFWASTDSGLFGHMEVSREEIQQSGLRPTPYPPTVWFEIVPDAFTTLFKRLGLGGWTELGHTACGTGCIENEIRWTDGFQTIDVALESFTVDDRPLQLPGPRWIRLEVWGGVRHAFARDHGELPVQGQKLRACGLLRRDDPYDWLEIHPQSSPDMAILGSCDR